MRYRRLESWTPPQERRRRFPGMDTAEGREGQQVGVGILSVSGRKHVRSTGLERQNLSDSSFEAAISGPRRRCFGGLGSPDLEVGQRPQIWAAVAEPAAANAAQTYRMHMQHPGVLHGERKAAAAVTRVAATRWRGRRCGWLLTLTLTLTIECGAAASAAAPGQSIAAAPSQSKWAPTSR